MTRILGLAGWSGSGKTTLLVGVLPLLRQRGLTVSTIKRAHHDLELDTPGKDSWRHRAAGADEVLVVSGRRWALLHEGPEPDLEDLLERMSPVDLVLIEGFKRHPHPKLEVYRPAVGKPLLCRQDPYIIAVASDTPLIGAGVPVLDLDDHRAVAAFIVTAAGLRWADRGPAARMPAE